MLQRSSHADEGLFINLTPMIDVILCLLVFFMTATRLYDWEAEEEKLDVAIPQVGYAQPLTQMPDDLTLTVQLDGSLLLNGTPVNPAELQRRLRAARENFAGQGVVIRADGQTTHQKVAEALSHCHAAGITRIRYSVQEVPQ